jgi:hypothetical protein
MSKKVPSVHAKHIDEIIDEIKVSGFGSEPAETLKTLVNRDVCLTDEQVALLLDKNCIPANLRHGRSTLDLHLLYNVYKQADDKTHFFALVAAINSCRIECSHCTNLLCEKRDPDFPLAEVKKQG